MFFAGCGPVVPADPTGSGGGGGTDGSSSPGATSISTGDSPSSSSTGSLAMVCEPDAIGCEGSEYGVWRLSSADTPVVAYLYLWPEDDDDPYSFVSRWYVDDTELEFCIRNGTYVPSGDLAGTFIFQTDGLGGTNVELCGGTPGEHEIRLELTRLPNCVGDVFALKATDSKGASIYAFEGEAVHCDCTTAYDPYTGLGQPLPTDDCVAP